MPESASLSCGNADVENPSCFRYPRHGGLLCGYCLLPESQSLNPFHHEFAIFYVQQIEMRVHAGKKEAPPNQQDLCMMDWALSCLQREL